MRPGQPSSQAVASTNAATEPTVQEEHRTDAIGTRVVYSRAATDGRARGRGRGSGRGRGDKTVSESKARAHKRPVRQYQWSTVGRDAFNVAQTKGLDIANNGNHSETRFERGEGGGVT